MRSKLYTIMLWAVVMIGSLNAESGTISGVITGENGDPIVGVNVWLKGTTIGSSTRTDGSYRINGVPDGTYELIAAHIGNQSVELPVTVSGNSVAVDISMMKGSISGEEVVVVHL